MSSTNKTTNYELSQFVGTDIPSILGDYNGDMRKIDSAIKDASVAGGENAVAIAELQTATNRMNTEIGGINSTVNTLSGKVVGIEGDVNDIKSCVPANASESNKLATMADISGGGGQIFNQDYLLYGDVVMNQSFNKADYIDMGHMFKAVNDYISSIASTGVQYIVTLSAQFGGKLYELFPVRVEKGTNNEMNFAGCRVALGSADSVEQCYANFTSADNTAYFVIRKLVFANTSYGDNPSTTAGAVTGYEIVHTADETTTMPDSIVVHKLINKSSVTP